MEMRETDIIADCEADLSSGRLCEHGSFTGAIGAALAVILAIADFHIEHVDLVIAGNDAALRANEK